MKKESSRNLEHRRDTVKQSYAILSVLLAGLMTLSCAKEKEKEVVPPAEFYLVIDTSGSMASGTMKRVKEKLPALLESAREGDRIHLLQFDEKPQTIGEYTIRSAEDHRTVEKAILDLKPSGAYTDIKQLIAYLKENTRSTNSSAKQYIVVLSDGIDDPRPGRKSRKDRVELKEYEATEKLPVQEPYIFYVHLGDKTSVAAEEGLKEDLKDLSTEVKVVKPIDAADAGLDEVKKDIEATRPPAETPWWQALWAKAKALPLWVWGCVAAALLLLLLLLRRAFRTIKPLEGILSFYEATEHPSMAREVNLHKFRRDDLTIGSQAGAVIRIKDSAFPAQIRLKAKRSGKDFLFGFAKKDLQRMEFLVQKKRGFISSGDRFRIANYTFEYSHGTKK
jgi:hypothetical protein